ncbi:MAG: DUF438 domain-containing protein [Chlorobi bacterium]|nr:DUF438 domain-containing protein [Chlorobiota bacterium]
MSELIDNRKLKIEQLTAYALGVLDGENGAELYRQYKTVLETAEPRDVITVVDALVKTNEEMDEIKRAVNKILNIFYEALKSKGKFEPRENGFLYFLMKENREMEKRMDRLRARVKAIFKEKDPKNALLKLKDEIKGDLLDLQEYEKHYAKKENIFFPYFEKYFEDFRCLKVMWSMHDDARRIIKSLLGNLDQDEPLISQFNMEIGKLYFSILPLIFREEYILYPMANRTLLPVHFEEMLLQSKEIGFSYIELPEGFSFGDDAVKKQEDKALESGLIDLGTGKLNVKEISMLFNHLPVDITYVDENDEVKYFSTPKDRFFVRSGAIIGRKVQNCHPHESVDVVNKIVASFKSGEKSVATFWINIKGKFILIRYFAVHDDSGNYKGVLEVSQDVTEIRKLEGERRLLDWK